MTEFVELHDMPDDASKTEARTRAWVILGYVSCLLAGLPGIFVGTMLTNAARISPDGTATYSFPEKARKHGKIILYLGCSMFILSILFFLNWLFLSLLFSNRLNFGFITH